MCGTLRVAFGLSVIAVVFVPQPARLYHIVYMGSLSPCQPYGMYITLLLSAVAAGCYMLVWSQTVKLSCVGWQSVVCLPNVMVFKGSDVSSG
jgi:hypothetical protein